MEHDSWDLPPKDGLYDPALEKDACGVGFIVSIDGKSCHKVSSENYCSIVIFISSLVTADRQT